jgi:hypothetical protein
MRARGGGRDERGVGAGGCVSEITGLEFRGPNTLKKKNSSDGHTDIINTRQYRWLKNRVYNL